MYHVKTYPEERLEKQATEFLLYVCIDETLADFSELIQCNQTVNL